MTNARKGLIKFRFVELHTNKNIAGMYHQVKEASGRLIAEGKSNAEGLSVQISRDIGTELHVYVKSTFTGQMKLKVKYALQHKEEIHRIISSKVLLDNVPLQQHEAPKGDYKRKTYAVVAGDTLTVIAHKNHCTVNDLISINALTDHGNHIVPSQVLKLPTDTGSRAPHAAGQTNTTQSPANQHPKHSDAKSISTNPRSDSSSSHGKTAPDNNASGKPKPAQPTSANTAADNKAPDKTPPAAGASVQKQQGNSEKTGAPVCDIKNTTCPCVCRDYDLIWGSKVDCEFRKKLIEISEELWPKDAKNMANNLMACMHLETGSTFSPTIGTFLRKNHKDTDEGGYVGLIQFGKYAALDLKIKRSELAKLTALEQLDWVKKYFQVRSIYKNINSLTALYLTINYPANVMNNHLSPNDVVYSAPENEETNSKKFKSSPYYQNPSFMKEIGEFTTHINKKGKRVVDNQGNKNGSTYVWEVTKSITEVHFKPGEKSKATKFECNNQPYPIANQQTSSNKLFDIEKFAHTLKKNAQQKSQHACAKYVRWALEAAGGNTKGYPVPASDWGPTLLQIGYIEIAQQFSNPQKGDIYIITKTKKHIYGHIAGYTGTEWISDFKQHSQVIYTDVVSYRYFRLQ